MVHQILTFTRTITSPVYIAVLIIGTIVLFTQAYSADDIIDSAVTTKTTLNGGDTLTITENGSITIPSNDIGVDMDGNNITINNSGSITGDGDGINTVSESVNNTVINSGSISTTGGSYDAIRVEDNSAVTNTGSISTTGSSSSGIDGDDGDTILNSGTITTAGNDSHAIFADETNTVTNSGTIITTGNDANGINVNENSIVTNTGSISTTGDDAHGIGVAADSTVTNSGSISTAGNDSSGIYVDDEDDVTITNTGSITAVNGHGFSLGNSDDSVANNSGTINVSGNSKHGIYIDDNGRVNNSGTILTSGVGGDGIYGHNYSTVINSGSISTSGDNADGIDVWQYSSITNSGTIATSGNSSPGIDADDYNTVINTGTITTSGSSSYGIEIDADSTFNNSGTITTTGSTAHGIYLKGDNITISNLGSVKVSGTNSSAIRIMNGFDNTVINNSGTISGDDHAILGETGDITLNLLQGSRVIGTVDLGDNGGDNDIVNIYGGSPSASLTIDNAEQISLFGSGVIVGNTVTTVDSTMENAYSVGLATMADSIHRTLNQRSTFKAPMKPVKVASLDLPPGLLFQEQKPVAWGQVFGGLRSHDAYDDAVAYDHKHYGVSGGYEWAFNDTSLGLMGGFAQSRAESDLTSFDTDVNHLFFGGYGSFSFNSIKVSTSLIGGYSDHDNKRYVYDNLNGLEAATSNTEGYFISPSVTLGTAYSFNQDYEFRPSLSVAYHLARINGYDESGTTQSNLTISDQTIKVLSSRLQLAVARTLDGQEVELRCGVTNRFTDNDKTEASLAGTTFRYSGAGDDSVYGFFAGINFQMATINALTLVADFEAGGAGGNEFFIDGNLKLEYRF